MEFLAFPKMPRLSRDIIITEKIDGTNAQIFITTADEVRPLLNAGQPVPPFVARVGELMIAAGSRTRWITVGKQTDNAGFAAWVSDHADELARLGVGRHYGEWWGKGIQRGYGLNEKRFSLFNVSRWANERPSCCHVVPTLYEGSFSMPAVEAMLDHLRTFGSVAAPGFKPAEGIVVFHTAAQLGFKKTLENDEIPKSQAAA